MIISKQGSNTYTDTKTRKEITDKKILDYITKLVIPPNYKDVIIFYNPTNTPKILYQGNDTKNRLQRIYSAEWNSQASRRKFCELLNFAEQIEKITEKTRKEILSKTNTKNKIISMIIRLVMVCYFRIGNKRYQELYGSFGAINILKRHIVFIKDKKNKEYVHISFKGKKGVTNTCDVYDNLLIAELKNNLRDKEDDESVFLWDNMGEQTPVSAIEVNMWLKEFDPILTSKNFRTYESNIMLIILLRINKSPNLLSISARKKIILDALNIISAKLNNTANILKKNYTQSGLISMYINEPTEFMRYFENEKTPREAFIFYLIDYCKGYEAPKRKT